MKRTLILLCLALLQAGALYAQKDATEKKTTIAVQPLQLFNYGGLRYDFEKRIGKTPAWLQLSLTGYPFLYDKSIDANNGAYYDHEYYWNPFGEDFDSMWGVSGDLNYKRFLNQVQSFYLAGGVSYGYFEMKYAGSAWNNYTEDGLQFHEQAYGVHKQTINRLGLNALFGYQIPTRNVLIFDMYIGLGYRYGIYDENKTAYDYGLFSPGRRNLIFLTGMRIGVGW